MPTVYDNIDTPFLENDGKNGLKDALELARRGDFCVDHLRHREGDLFLTDHVRSAILALYDHLLTTEAVGKLTIPDFQQILTTLPPVDESLKSQTANAFRNLLQFGSFPCSTLSPSPSA